MESFIFFLIPLGFGCVALLVYRQQIRHQDNLLAEQARKRDGNVVKGILSYPKLFFKYRTYGIQVFSQAGNRNSPPHTYVKSSLLIPRYIKLTLHKQGILGALGEMVGIRDLQIGHANFDEAFTIRGNDEIFIRALLNSVVQQELLSLHQKFERVLINPHTFELSVRYIPQIGYEHDHLLDVVLACFDQLDACTRIQTIIFGKDVPEATDAEQILVNPEISDTIAPMLTLQKVVIDTATYDFFQVERFFTYALDAIGQQYLKDHVEVVIYGDEEKLQPNLRNMLSNVCKDVYLHGKPKQFDPTGL